MLPWLLLVIVTLVLSFGTMAYLKSVFARASRVPVASGLTGAQTAARILEWAGIRDVEITQGDSFLGDHYDPLHKKLVLSPENYQGTSAANVGVAAHECGHALQHQHHYAPLEIRMASVYATTFANTTINYVVLASLFFFHLISPYVAIWVIAVCSGIIMLFNLITLPVEYDASARAKAVLNQLGIVRPGPEAQAVSATLNAAGLTYVAAFLSSLLQFLYYLMLLMGRRN